MMALEHVCRVLDDYAQELWRGVKRGLITCLVPDVCPSMTMEERGRLTADLHTTAAHMSSILRMKMSYWQTLLRGTYGAPTGLQWDSSGTPIGLQWGANGAPVGLQWDCLTCGYGQ